MNTNEPLNRRQFLRLAGLATAGAAAACAPRYPLQAPAAAPGTRVLRIAHMTDFHVQPEGYAAKGMALALQHAGNLADPPDFLLNTGDSIMDSLDASKERTLAQWETFLKVLDEGWNLPAYHAIGNHDVWGWGSDYPWIKEDPLYGKAMAVKMLALENRYYSFERAGWRFIVLDSTHLPNEVSQHPYIGKIDDEQFSWMKSEIERTPGDQYICIVSHIPILCACEFFDGENEVSGNWVVPAAWMHIDARRFRTLFLDHPNIRLCLSGHAHQYETLEYLGVKYFNDGAISANWWAGSFLNFPPAYVLVDLYDNGEAVSTFVPYETG